MKLFLKLLALELTLTHFVQLATKDLYIHHLPLRDYWNISQATQRYHIQLLSHHCHQPHLPQNIQANRRTITLLVIHLPI